MTNFSIVADKDFRFNVDADEVESWIREEFSGFASDLGASGAELSYEVTNILDNMAFVTFDIEVVRETNKDFKTIVTNALIEAGFDIA